MSRRSLPTLAPSLVIVLGVTVAALVALLGFVELRARGDAALAFRSEALALSLSERLRAIGSADRPAFVEKAAERSGAEILLVDQTGRLVIDGSLGPPNRQGIVDLLVQGQGETTTRVGRTRFHAATLGSAREALAIIVFVPAPEVPSAAWSLLQNVTALTVLLVGAAGFVAFAFARDVHSDVAFVRGRIATMAREAGGPSGKLVPVRDADAVGVLTCAFNQLVERFTAAEHAYRQDLTGALAFDRDRTAFLAALSHELRTPLNAILGFTDVLLTEVDGPLSEDARDNLTVLRHSAEHLRGLIDDILDLSALESGQLRLELGTVDLFDVAADVARQARVAADEKRISLTLSGRPVTAWVDRRRVRQILDNLVGNAVKFTSTGEVCIDVGSDEDSVVLGVSDTGPGIPKSQQLAIFDEYWQAPATRHAGAGLGLAITRRLVRMHGGSIALASEPGRGSHFTVRLPIQPPTTPMTRFISTAPPPASERSTREVAG